MADREAHIASLRALSVWLMSNDLDMKLPDAVDIDPDDTADFLAAMPPISALSAPPPPAA